MADGWLTGSVAGWLDECDWTVAGWAHDWQRDGWAAAVAAACVFGRRWLGREKRKMRRAGRPALWRWATAAAECSRLLPVTESIA